MMPSTLIGCALNSRKQAWILDPTSSVDSDAHSKRSFARSATQLGEHGNLNLALFPAGFFHCPLDARCVLVRYPIRTALRTDDRGYVADYDNSETELGGECGRTGLPSATANGTLIG
jgi:hypothetical protein